MNELHTRHKPSNRDDFFYKFYGSPRIRIFVFVLVLLFIFLLFYFSVPKNCKSDDECFNTLASQCKKVKANLEKDGDLLNYIIKGKKNDNCILTIKMLKVSEDKSADIGKALNNRYMDCAVPLTVINKKPVKEITEINDYCSGSLKEAFLEISLQKMYELVVSDIGNVTIALHEAVSAIGGK